MKPTAAETSHQAQARVLLTNVRAAPVTAFPRREPIIAWLNGYLIRAEQKGYVTGEAEAKDLIALERFLRMYHVPTTEESAA